ncbi:MAG: class I SAM-dependent methyltransferase [Chlorobiaceae bacterium]|jgi:SAM-dependent methyltransferase|nr:class I SAM-dependent methyltransferase [Chlorobiaceae bacterium]
MTGSQDASGSRTTAPWFAEWFNHPFYLQVYSHRNKEEAAQCIRTILSYTGLSLKNPASVSVLDIACGAGRHAIELAKLGYCVTGNDLSPFLLEEARNESTRCDVNLHLTCRDMRNIESLSLFDLVVQLFTSFGYFDSDQDDLLVLQHVYNALKTGGWYVLDLINPVYLEKHIVTESERKAGNLFVHEKRVLEERKITKTITISAPDRETINFTESVRLYSKKEILGLLGKGGFSVTGIVGNYSGEPFNPEESPRMMIFSRKP